MAKSKKKVTKGAKLNNRTANKKLVPPITRTVGKLNPTSPFTVLPNPGRGVG